MEIRDKNGSTLAASHGRMEDGENLQRQVFNIEADDVILRMELCTGNCLCYIAIDTKKGKHYQCGVGKSDVKAFGNLDKAGHGVSFRTGAWVDGMTIIYDSEYPVLC